MGERWDIVVIGAGPAGSVAARACARRGARVMLVDKARFPRWKVCGCCLNARALAALADEGLGDLCVSRGARPLTRVVLAAGGRCAAFGLSGGAALSRQMFDTALVEAARAGGVVVREGVSAAVAPHWDGRRRIRLRGDPGDEVIQAPVVIVADGLGGRSLDGDAAFRREIVRGARMGAGAVVGRGLDWVEPGAVHMACGRGGYVGFVRLEDGAVDVGAAFDAAWVRTTGGPAAAARAVAEEAGVGDVAALAGATWRGTPALTRRRRPVAQDGVFIVGDAAGYVEPFTGEGMAWALATGAAVADVAVSAAGGWDTDHARQWRRRYASLIGRRQRACAAVAWSLRRPALVRAAVAALRVAPGIDRDRLSRFMAWIGGSSVAPDALGEDAA